MILIRHSPWEAADELAEHDVLLLCTGLPRDLGLEFAHLHFGGRDHPVLSQWCEVLEGAERLLGCAVA